MKILFLYWIQERIKCESTDTVVRVDGKWVQLEYNKVEMSKCSGCVLVTVTSLVSLHGMLDWQERKHDWQLLFIVYHCHTLICLSFTITSVSMGLSLGEVAMHWSMISAKGSHWTILACLALPASLSYASTLEWVGLLLDSHFTSLSLVPEAGSRFTEISSVINKQVRTELFVLVGVEWLLCCPADQIPVSAPVCGGVLFHGEKEH